MALKENLQSIKTEISSEEQFLENMIRGERFFKKYLKPLIIVLVIVIVAFCVYKFMDYKKESNIISANEAYERLIQKTPQKDDEEMLKKNAPSLYAMYVLSDENSSSEKLMQIKTLQGVDPLLIDLAKFKTDKSNEILLGNYKALLNGFEFMKNKEFGKAEIEFAKIPMDSNLQKVVKNLKHYNNGKQK